MERDPRCAAGIRFEKDELGTDSRALEDGERHSAVAEKWSLFDIVMVAVRSRDIPESGGPELKANRH